MEKISGYVVAAFLVFVMALSGCSGGGSAASADNNNNGGTTNPPPVNACTDEMKNTWTPDASATPENQTVDQKNGCEETRTVQGTKFVDYWQERAGASVATPFKSYSGMMRGIVTTKDGVQGSVLFGQDVVTKKGALALLDANGNQLFSVQINPVLGNEVIPHNIDCDGNRIAVAFECLPYNDWYVAVYDMNGNRTSALININGPTPIFSDDWRVESAVVKLDGYYLVNRRIYKSGKSMLLYADLNFGAAPIFAAPLVDPQFLMTDAFGINIVGQGGIVKYDRALVAQGDPVGWRNPGSNLKIHDSITVSNLIYTALESNGILVLSKFGDPAFRNTANISMGNDKVKLLPTADGKILVYLGNRIGWLDKTTGELATTRPVAVPANAEAFVSGANVYFVMNGNALHVLPLSQIP